jgi:hypothetical protein
LCAAVASLRNGVIFPEFVICDCGLSDPQWTTPNAACRTARLPCKKNGIIDTKTAQKGGHDMNQTIYDYIGLGAVIVTIILLVVLLNVATARARSKMTPEERAEHDEEVSRLEQEW